MSSSSPSLSRRDFLRLTGLTAAGLALAGCQPGKPGASSGPVKLVYQDWRTEWFPAMAQTALEKFHADHPDIRVYYTPDPPDVEVSLLKDAQAGNAPDVFAACCTFFPILAQHKQTLDLTERVKSELDAAIISDWDAAQYQALRSRDGVQYGLPKYHGALALYYNKDIFDEFKVDYPDDSWTMDDYLEAMKRLTQDRDGDGKPDLWGGMVDISWDRLQVYANSWGGRFVDADDPARSRMADPQTLQALEWLRARMWDDRVMACALDVESLSTRQAFARGKLATVEDGSWALKDILSEAQFRVGVAPRPAGPARRATLATTDGFGIYARTAHPDQAWELLKFLVSKEYGLAMAQAHFLQPARLSLIENWVEFVRSEFPNQARDVDLAAFAHGQINNYSVTTETFLNMEAATQLAYSAWDKIFNLGQASVDDLTAVSQEIEKVQK